MAEFYSTNTYLGSFVVTIFVLGLGTGPLGSLSEIYGRLPMQHIGNVGFLVFTVACAESKSLGALIGMRLPQVIFAAVPLTNGGAVIADMVKQEERGFALAMFTTRILLGPTIGPICPGFLAAARGWSWVFGLLLLLCVFIVSIF
jgi:MFS family permease